MNQLDVSLEKMLNTRFDVIYSDIVRSLAKLNSFNTNELRCILMVYHKFVLANGPKAKRMSTRQFVLFSSIVLGIDLEHIIYRILALYGQGEKNDVAPETFVRIFDIFFSSSMDRRMRYVFEVYNFKNLGFVNREIVIKAVEGFFLSVEDEDELNELKSDMVDVIFEKYDADKDGIISFEDYMRVVTKQPIALEFLYPCLPSKEAMAVTAYCANLMRIIDMDVFKTKLRKLIRPSQARKRHSKRAKKKKEKENEDKKKEQERRSSAKSAKSNKSNKIKGKEASKDAGKGKEAAKDAGKGKEAAKDAGKGKEAGKQKK